jgi:hypothetical protein
MTAADQIRRAAARLRELAEDATPGPWQTDGPWWVDPPGTPMTSSEATVECRTGVTAGSERRVVAEGTLRSRDEDMHYIAALGPDVGSALADWLEGEHIGWIGDFEEYHDRAASAYGDEPSVEYLDHCKVIAADYAVGRHRNALAVARKILGES